MISYFTIEDYFGKWREHDDVTPEVFQSAEVLLVKVNMVCEVADMSGIDFPLNPKTKSYVSGEQYGGFRPRNCTIGAPASSHKTGQGIDIYDPKHEIAMYFYKHQALLKEHALAMECPEDTPTWCHLTTRFPKSGKTCFKP